MIRALRLTRDLVTGLLVIFLLLICAYAVMIALDILPQGFEPRSTQASLEPVAAFTGKLLLLLNPDRIARLFSHFRTIREDSQKPAPDRRRRDEN